MRSLIICLSALAISGMAAPKAAAAPAPHNNPGQRNAHALFARWDLDNDGVLDAAELAKAFRGPKAKPVNGKPALDDQHADHAFLARFDSNKDRKIDRAEFEKYEQTFISNNNHRKRGKNYNRGHRPNRFAGLRGHRPGIRR